MPATFLVSDTHFGHSSICRFTRDDGSPLRPWNDVTLMDEEMKDLWNETVRPRDIVYHLGDVAMGHPESLHILGKLHGRKILIKGNHDTFPIDDYMQYFDNIESYKIINGMLLSHIPVHKNSIGRYGTNIHGHLHYRVVESEPGIIDTNYWCACVEHTEYKPITLEDAFQRIEDQGGIVGFRAKATYQD